MTEKKYICTAAKGVRHCSGGVFPRPDPYNCVVNRVVCKFLKVSADIVICPRSIGGCISVSHCKHAEPHECDNLCNQYFCDVIQDHIVCQPYDPKDPDMPKLPVKLLPVSIKIKSGTGLNETAKVIEFENPNNNDSGTIIIAHVYRSGNTHIDIRYCSKGVNIILPQLEGGLAITTEENKPE